MVRKGDAAFKKVVDKAITDTYASGEVNKIYDKWFTQPIPPKGLNLNFPMSEELKKLIASPTDKAADQMKRAPGVPPAAPARRASPPPRSGASGTREGPAPPQPSPPEEQRRRPARPRRRLPSPPVSATD